MGSGTTAVCCMETNRNYLGFELDETYFNICNRRIKQHTSSKDDSLNEKNALEAELY